METRLMIPATILALASCQKPAEMKTTSAMQQEVFGNGSVKIRL